MVNPTPLNSFTQSQPITNNPLQNGTYTSSNNYNAFNPVGSYAGSNLGTNYTPSVSKPSSSYYESAYDSKVEQKKPASYNPQIQTSLETKKPGYYEPVSTNPSPTIPTYPTTKPGKNPYGLNVS